VPWRGPDPDCPDEVPTLGYLNGEWIERHCVVADGDSRAKPYGLTDEMWTFLAHFYRVRVDARADDPASKVSAHRTASKDAWTYRRGQLVRPQKWGKGPFSAAIVCTEAVGPTYFAGWAAAGDVYDCADHGCPCGWVYAYREGDPMGRPWSTPLIQITAASEDQTDNVWRQLVPMIELGPLAWIIPDTGETRINLPGGGKIEPVTSKARSRLGAPITFCVQDETGTWTVSNGGQNLADTQRRGLAGMGGRALETTNAWDPAESSVAQKTFESRALDIYRDYRQAPKTWSYGDKRERRKIHKFVYGDSWWVSLDRIEADAVELMERDPTQAERFFGNRPVITGGSWLKEGLWASRTAPERVVSPGTEVCLGFDGSDSDDFTAIRLETASGFRFTPVYGPDKRPTVWNPAEWGGSIPRAEVHAAVDEICRRFNVRKAYCDPRDWQSEIGDWAQRHGEQIFLEWQTYRIVQMHAALQRLVVDLGSGRTDHDACLITEQHAANARKLARNGDRYILGKPNQNQKIDAAMADVLCHEAAADARAEGWGTDTGSYGFAYV
jgi:hypothetical protein